MRSSLDYQYAVYAGIAQLCGSATIMRKIMRAYNRIIPRPGVTQSVLTTQAKMRNGLSQLSVQLYRSY